jgi:aminomethyltransferase
LRATRNQAGLFDVSHMGQIRVQGAHAAASLESLIPVDVADLKTNRQRYALFTNDNGGILDDLMVANMGDYFFLVVNAARKEHDLEHMRKFLGAQCNIEPVTDHALLALQGPAAATVMARLVPETKTMGFMAVAAFEILGVKCNVSRSGYTGEDGFEISVPEKHAEELARFLLAQPEVAPVGLGARDSLRLEAGLCLYGHDMDEFTTPVEAGLVWALSKVRRDGGARAGHYPGAEVIQEQMARGVARQRVGLRPKGRVPVREGAVLSTASGEEIGKVTSGTFGPTANQPVAMGYVQVAYATQGTEVYATVRDQLVQMEVVSMPFVPHRYYRGENKA